MITRQKAMYARYRSLLQKAVRRGCVDLVYIVCAMLADFGPKQKNWIRKRASVITFEECWPLGSDLMFNKTFHSKVAALVKAARAAKAKDAAGLALLADALSNGSRLVLNDLPDSRPVRIIASAIRRPDDFWRWVDQQDVPQRRKALIGNAVRRKNIGQVQERACTQAAAYLAATRDMPALKDDKRPSSDFPYWVALDGHTRQGRRALMDISRDLHMSTELLTWSLFYFQGCVTNRAVDAVWWDRACRWRFKDLGMPLEEAHLLWEPAEPQLIEALKEDAAILHKEIYRWKMKHLDQVEALKKKVELYLAKFNELQKEQVKLF